MEFGFIIFANPVFFHAPHKTGRSRTSCVLGGAGSALGSSAGLIACPSPFTIVHLLSFEKLTWNHFNMFPFGWLRWGMRSWLQRCGKCEGVLLGRVHLQNMSVALLSSIHSDVNSAAACVFKNTLKRDALLPERAVSISDVLSPAGPVQSVAGPRLHPAPALAAGPGASSHHHLLGSVAPFG